MKTDEEKGKYGSGASEVEDSTNNAMAMLGAGYSAEPPMVQLVDRGFLSLYAFLSPDGWLQLSRKHETKKSSYRVLVSIPPDGCQKLLDLLTKGEENG